MPSLQLPPRLAPAVASFALIGCGTTPCAVCGVSGYQVVVQQANLSAQQARTIVAQCPAGKKAVGGGFSGTQPEFQVFESRPISDGTGWQISAKSAYILPSSIQADAYVVCANE